MSQKSCTFQGCTVKNPKVMCIINTLSKNWIFLCIHFTQFRLYNLMTVWKRTLSLFITRCRTKDTGTRLSVQPCVARSFHRAFFAKLFFSFYIDVFTVCLHVFYSISIHVFYMRLLHALLSSLCDTDCWWSFPNRSSRCSRLSLQNVGSNWAAPHWQQKRKASASVQARNHWAFFDFGGKTNGTNETSVEQSLEVKLPSDWQI